MEIFLLPKPFKIVIDDKAVTTFLKKILDNGPHMHELHR